MVHPADLVGQFCFRDDGRIFYGEGGFGEPVQNKKNNNRTGQIFIETEKIKFLESSGCFHEGT